MKQIFNLIAAALILLAFSDPRAAQAQDSVLKVGVILPLSGVMADWGKSIQAGALFANKDAQGKVTYIFEDEAACDTKLALAGAHKLIAIDKVALILTGCLNGTRAILPITKKANVPVVSLGLVNDDLAEEFKGSLLTPSASISAEADGISKLLKADQKRRLAVLRVEDNFTEELLKGLKRFSVRDHWEIVADETASFDNGDFRSPLLKISKLNADAILFYMSTEQVVTAMKQLRELKLNSLATYAGYVIEADPPPAQDLQILNGVRFVAAMTPKDDDLSKALTAEGIKETFQTRVAADLASDLVLAHKECSKLNNSSSCLLSSLRSRETSRPAFSGGFSYDAQGLAQRSIKPKQIIAGEYRWIESQAPIAND